MTDLKSARPELLALATAVRDEGWAAQLDGALTAAAYNSDWDWPRTARYAARLIFDPEAQPRELLDAVRGPIERTKPAPPGVAAAALVEMRAVVAASTGPTPQATEGQ